MLHKQGFTLVEAMVVVMLTGIIAAIALPSFTRARQRAEVGGCQQNLRMLNEVSQQYLFEYPDAGVLTTSDLQDYFQGSTAPLCPAGGNYAVYTDPTVIPTCDLGPTRGHVLQ